MSPDVFLSRQNPPVKYDGRGGPGEFPGSPKEVADALMALNATRTYNASVEDFVYDRYEPDFVAVSSNPGQNPNADSQEWVGKENKAIELYDTLVSAGAQYSRIIAAVKEINRIRMIKGGSVFLPPSDFDIIAAQKTSTGVIARYLKANRVLLQGDTSMFDEVTIQRMLWFDTLEAFNHLNVYYSSLQTS